MQLLAEKFTDPTDASFSVQVKYMPYHDPFLHFHDDYELVAILNAEGTRFIGDHVGEFSGDEVVLVGPQVPHCWHIAESSNGKKPKAIVVHFTENFLGKDFFRTPEFSGFYGLLQQSVRGMLLKGDTLEKIIFMMKGLADARELRRILLLLEIFEKINANQNRKLLASTAYTPLANRDNYQRINKIYEFVNYNFAKSINLKEVADLVHLSPAAFCRYFKRTTQRTFFDYVKEIKVGYASKMLRESNLSIAEICYASGYNNVANFNRQFKQLKSRTPSQYRRAYRQGEIQSKTA